MRSAGTPTAMSITDKVWHLYRPSMQAAGLPSPNTGESYDYLVDARGTRWNIQRIVAKSAWSFVILYTTEDV
jgi:hypothetical protein